MSRKRKPPETLEDIVGELVGAGQAKARQAAENMAEEVAQHAINHGKKAFRNTIKGLISWADKNIK
jgi:Mg2+/Co2+ transporter CorB